VLLLVRLLLLLLYVNLLVWRRAQVPGSITEKARSAQAGSLH
jgi:hypothetical protein